MLTPEQEDLMDKILKFTLANYLLFEKLMGDVSAIPEYRKSKVDGFMDLSLDKLSERGDKITFALAHNYIHGSGDLIPDPDMEMTLDLSQRLLTAVSYQDIYGYQNIMVGEGKVVVV